MKNLSKKTKAIISVILILVLIMTCFCSCKKKTVEEETTIIVDENDDDIVDIEDEDKEDPDDGEEIDDGEKEEPEEETYWNNSYYKITKTGQSKDYIGNIHIIHVLEAKQTGLIQCKLTVILDGEVTDEIETWSYLMEGEKEFFDYELPDGTVYTGEYNYSYALYEGEDINDFIVIPNTLEMTDCIIDNDNDKITVYMKQNAELEKYSAVKFIGYNDGEIAYACAFVVESLSFIDDPNGVGSTCSFALDDFCKAGLEFDEIEVFYTFAGV